MEHTQATRAYDLSTPYGDRYYIHLDGAIERADKQNGPGSSSWLMLGLKHVNRNKVIPFEQLAARLDSITWRYKNGKPQWTVIDLDHGTRRIWGNTAYHGVARMDKVVAR